jgi:DNA-binding response OmpR family regulator
VVQAKFATSGTGTLEKGQGEATPTPMPSILLVEDDADFRELLATLLQRERFGVVEAASGEEMYRRLSDEVVDLILLDIRLPDSDGLELLRALRQHSDIPVVMVTGVDTPVDRVLGLEFGADDYICKPFESRELVARVKSVLRRVGTLRGSVARGEALIYVFAEYFLDVTQRSLSHQSGEKVELTGGEFDLLKALVEAANRPLTREQLLDLTRARQWSPYDRSIDVLVGRLRKKIERDPARPELIRTVRSVGYVFSANVEVRAHNRANGDHN